MEEDRKVSIKSPPRGRPRNFECPDELAAAMEGYFEWLEANPLYRKQVVSYQGEVQLVDVPLTRVPTLEGLRMWLGVGQTQWQDWRTEVSPGLSGPVLAAEERIRHIKFTGAASELFNSSFIARDLGLADRQDHSSTDGTMRPVSRIELVAPGEAQDVDDAED